MKILITGANGFIGHHLVRVFLEKGYEIRVLVRENSDLSLLKKFDIEYFYGDIRDTKSLKKALDGVDGLIHNASLVKDWGNYRDFYEINVNGTKNILEICKKNEIKKILITGTNSVYGEENNHIIKDERYKLDSHYKYSLDKIFPSKMNYYRDTKRMAKELINDYAIKNKMDIVIIEPVWVYGEGEVNGGFYQYIKSIKDGMKIMPGSKKNKFSVIYVRDLADIYLKLFEAENRGVESYLATNPDIKYMDEIYTTFCQKSSLNKPKYIKKGLIYPIAFLIEAFYTIFKIKNPPLLTRARINMFYDNIEYRGLKVEDKIGPIKYTSLEEGIEKTVNWYKEQGLI